LAEKAASLIQKNSQLEAKLSLKEIEGQSIHGELEKVKAKNDELEKELRQ